MTLTTSTAVERRQQLQATYDAPAVRLGEALCDAHPGSAVALRLVDEDQTVREVTFGELTYEASRLAAALADLGVGPGDRVATLMGKSQELVTCVLAIWRLGAVHVPLFTAFAPPAVEFRLRASAAKVVMVDATQRDKLDAVDAGSTVVSTGEGRASDLSYAALIAGAEGDVLAAAYAPDDPFIMIFTSGTTGTPKGVMTPVRAVAGMQFYLEYGLGVGPGDVYWNAADPGWAYGLFYAIIAPLAAGVTTTLLTAPFAPDATWQLLNSLAITNFAAAPTVYRALRAAEPASRGQLALACCSSAGEPLDEPILVWARDGLGCEIRDHYGQTELGMVIASAWNPEIRRPVEPASMGQPLPGWRVAILSPDRDEPVPDGVFGRLAIDIAASSAMTFSGYYNAPERTAERITSDGRWYITGDTAKREHDYLYFTSRDDDLIIMAGYRIGPFEIESVLTGHPDVAEAAAVGIPDQMRGEVLEAFIVLRPGAIASDGLVAELQNLVKNEYAAHAYPRQVHFIEALPRTPSGKVQRFLLRDQRRAKLQTANAGRLT